jgi:MFS family permease
VSRPADRSAQPTVRGAEPAGPPRKTSFLLDLRSILSGQGFRRLYATRLISQTGDGLFNAGFGAYVFFSAQVFPNPAAAAKAFAVLYLPYSLVGPFVGVFIDRWSRRQILVWSALIRTGFVVIAGSFVASGTLGLPLYIAALAVLGVNRFFLSALSASLPHVVAGDKLVTANSVTQTSGTIAAFAGGLLGLGARLYTSSGPGVSALIMLAAGAGYLAAGLIAVTMDRDLLGPDRQAARLPPGLLPELASVAAGLAAGARYVWHRRPVAAALVATGCHRLLYGILLLMSILLYRNYFYPASSANLSLQHFTLLVAASAVGYGAGALITPAATRRLAKAVWITCMLAGAGLLTGALGVTFRQIPFLIIGFVLGVAAQSVAICTTTILQQEVADDFRGRAFSINDMLFNVTFVLGAAVSALFMPLTGKSYPMLAVVAIGYLVAAAAYRIVSRQALSRQAPGAGPSPSPSAQASSS